jgi:hypothetical protein
MGATLDLKAGALGAFGATSFECVEFEDGSVMAGDGGMTGAIAEVSGAEAEEPAVTLLLGAAEVPGGAATPGMMSSMAET